MFPKHSYKRVKFAKTFSSLGSLALSGISSTIIIENSIFVEVGNVLLHERYFKIPCEFIPINFIHARTATVQNEICKLISKSVL